MTGSFGVDTLHLLAKEATVGGGVAELVDGDVIMDHLMKDGIFDEVFRQVNTGVDTEDKVLVTGRSEEPRAMLGEGEFAEESAGMGEFDGDRRERPAEEAGVVFIKAGLDVINRRLHLEFKIYS
jgi:hypothetical protein